MPVSGANISSGMNMGEAQVLPSYDSSGLFQARYNIGERKHAQQQEREAGIEKGLEKVNDKGIFQPHQQVFAKKITDFRNYTKENIDKLRKGDINATLDWQNQLANLTNQIDQSNQVRKSYEETWRKLTPDQKMKLRPESVEYADKFGSDPSASYDEKNDMFQQFDPNQIKENINYQDRVVKELKPYANATALANEQGGTYEKDGVRYETKSKTFTYGQAKDLIAKDLADPHLFEQANYDFQNATDKLGAKDPVEYYQKKYAPDLVVKGSITTGSGQGNSKKDYSFGDGMASNNQYSFVRTDKSSEGVGKPLKQYQQIDIASTDNSENKPLLLPKSNGEEVNMTPLKLEQNDGKWNLVAIEKETQDGIPTGKNVEHKIPVEKVKGKFTANYGIAPEELINNLTKGKTATTNTKTNSTSTKSNIMYSKSKSGKDIYSDDGGVTWKYK